MKKIILFFLCFFLVGCSNKSDVIIKEENDNNIYCYKKYEHYEEYVDITYNDSNINNIDYTFVFDNLNEKSIKDLELLLNNYIDVEYTIKNNTVTIIFNFDKVNRDIYVNIKNYLIKNLLINKDNYDYYVDSKINYSKFVNIYLKDYSCE